jgi:hypothetical protein
MTPVRCSFRIRRHVRMSESAILVVLQKGPKEGLPEGANPIFVLLKMLDPMVVGRIGR